VKLNLVTSTYRLENIFRRESNSLSRPTGIATVRNLFVVGVLIFIF